MAYSIPEKEPETIVAGDRVRWKRTDLSDFPASEWTLTYYLRGSGAGHQYDIVADADGSDFEVDESPDDTASYQPGTYFVTAYVSQSGDRKHVWSGRIEVKANPVDITHPVDGRSHARRMVDAINATLENRATSDMQRYVFQAVGRSVDKIPLKELTDLLTYFENKVAQEDAANGVGKSGRILVRFSL